MISHTVVVTKPKVVVAPPAQTLTSIGYQVTNQQEYNDFLNDLRFAVGDYVTMVPNDVSSPTQIHMVCEIQTDYLQVEFGRMFEPKPYLMCSAFLHQGGVSPLGPWVRWDLETNYRKLTQTEYLKFIGSAHDSVSSGCYANAQQYKSSRVKGRLP